MENEPQLNPAPKAAKKRHFQQIRDWKAKHPKRFWAIIIVALLALIGGATWAAMTLNAPKPAVPVVKPVKKVAPPPKIYYSPLTGVKVADEAATKQPVTAIMIENSPDARPQSGIKDAGIIYEAVAEAGITRFLAIYQEAKPQLIGPVRSVRMYYVDWAAAYNASIAHIGGSAAALAEVRNGSYRDIDQFFNAPYYWRASDRYAPHNVYTSFEKLDALNAAKGYTSSEFKGFPRTDKKAADAAAANSIDISFTSAAWYATHYDYDAASNTYLRAVGGEAHNDREAGRLAPTVVVALHVAMSSVMEDGVRESIATIGTGEAQIFQNGTVVNATWRKNSKTEPLELLDSAGAPIALARGQTWIAAVPNDTGRITWQ